VTVRNLEVGPVADKTDMPSTMIVGMLTDETLRLMSITGF
jgi:hypothetical protein